jgi:YozE SAM-like fold
MTTFTEWLIQQTCHPDDLIRTLAREVAEDEDWPASRRSITTFHRYLDRCHADDQAHDGLTRAWAEYRATRRTRS